MPVPTRLLAGGNPSICFGYAARAQRDSVSHAGRMGTSEIEEPNVLGAGKSFDVGLDLLDCLHGINLSSYGDFHVVCHPVGLGARCARPQAPGVPKEIIELILLIFERIPFFDPEPL
uniref:Uncharacterized protein n=1 Tax=Candidatus Kentrum sp. TC TaxID=2126339 RepID=A0A450YLG1_9GAMM|nr:MAG: hypothetical protein BECKTC1821E_GA0114239_101830 [Candidatus Kentron sp. TC]